VLQHVAVCCSALQQKICPLLSGSARLTRCIDAVCCSVLLCGAVSFDKVYRRSVLQRVAVWCSVVQCFAVCCSALEQKIRHPVSGSARLTRCIDALCCSVLQHDTVCCSVLQRVAV